MLKLKFLADRLTYANVVATLALFSGIGGVSYAAIVLPPHSVGPRQLRAHAVGLGALDFPLGTIGITNDKTEDLTKNGCNGGPFSGNAAPDCTPPARGGPTPGREVHIHFSSPGRLVISAIVGLRNEGPVSTTATITLGLNVDRQQIAETKADIPGGDNAVQVPIQRLANLSSGMHSVGLAIRAEYHSSVPGDAVITAVSLIASAMPWPKATAQIPSGYPQ
jgi:hypothetical protein